jgi:CRP-like cAMP-binding protein
MQPITIEELKKVVALKGLPDEHLKWILDHSEGMEYDDGEVVAKTGDPAEWMFFIIECTIDFYLNMIGRLILYYHFANDAGTGGVTGLLPYSRMKAYSGNSIVTEKIRGLRLHKKYFQEDSEKIKRLPGNSNSPKDLKVNLEQEGIEQRF